MIGMVRYDHPVLKDFRDLGSNSRRESFLDRHDYLWGLIGTVFLVVLLVGAFA